MQIRNKVMPHLWARPVSLTSARGMTGAPQ